MITQQQKNVLDMAQRVTLLGGWRLAGAHMNINGERECLMKPAMCVCAPVSGPNERCLFNFIPISRAIRLVHVCLCLCVYLCFMRKYKIMIRVHMYVCTTPNSASSNLSLEKSCRSQRTHSTHRSEPNRTMCVIWFYTLQRKHPKHLINVLCIKMVKVSYKIIIRKCMFNYEVGASMRDGKAHTHTHARLTIHSSERERARAVRSNTHHNNNNNNNFT